MFYACLRLKAESKAQNNSQQIIKKEFNTRDEARAYIASIRDNEVQGSLYDQFWTE